MTSSPARSSLATTCPACSELSGTRELAGPDGVEIHACLTPESETGQGLSSQVESLLRQRESLRHRGDGEPLSTITETWFLSRAEAVALESIEAGDGAGESPARCVLVEPSCCSRCQVSLQVHLGRARSELLAAPAPGVSVHRHRDGRGHVHLRISGLVPTTAGGGERPLEELFAAALEELDRQGARLSSVVRTWFYLRHMERDYDALNRIRRNVFEREGIVTHPASTGIGGAPADASLDFAMSLYAVVPADESLHVGTLHSSTFNEAAEYGAFFSRGMEVRGTDQALYLSGTAAVDRDGHSTGQDCLESQVVKMLENVRGLLAGADAGPGDIVQVTSYLKRRDLFEKYLELFGREGFLGLPHTVVEAEVCRPELLCEMELIARRSTGDS